RSLRLYADLRRSFGHATRGGWHSEMDGFAPVSQIREYLWMAGKRGRKVSAVFGVSPERVGAAVRYLRRGAPDAPVWLFCDSAPDVETGALCERVFSSSDGLALLIEAEKQLWPHWV